MMQASSDTPPADKRRGGRPRGGSKVPWLEVEKLIVQGEEVVDPLTKQKSKRYPSYREIAKRYGVTHGSVAGQGVRRKWMQRREELQRIETERKTQQLVKAGALSIEDAISILDDWIRLFADDIKAKKVRTDSAADLNTLLRVRELLVGNVDSRAEVQGQFSLVALQESYAKYRHQVIDMTPELDGTAGCDGDTLDGDQRLDVALAGE